MMLTIRNDFPGGNIIVDQINGDHVALRHDQRGSTAPWFYWYFAVHGAAGRTLQFTFTDGDVIGERGPCVSRDGGTSWQWLGRAGVRGTSFDFDFAPGDDEVRFCFCIPYLESDLRRFLGETAGVQREVLCRSPKGRAVELLRVGSAAASRWVLVTARHHACESTGSFVLEGLLRGWQEAGRDDVALLAVPFVDKDGVEDGDQGKARAPHDHNRDYRREPRPLYPEVAALIKLVDDRGPPVVDLDLHAPWIRGTWNDCVYVVGACDEATAARQRRFLALWSGCAAGPLPVRSDGMLPYGQAWNTMDRSETSTHSRWLTAVGCPLAMSIEFPYAQVGAVATSAAALRAAGRDVAHALVDYLA